MVDTCSTQRSSPGAQRVISIRAQETSEIIGERGVLKKIICRVLGLVIYLHNLPAGRGKWPTALSPIRAPKSIR